MFGANKLILCFKPIQCQLSSFFLMILIFTRMFELLHNYASIIMALFSAHKNSLWFTFFALSITRVVDLWLACG